MAGTRKLNREMLLEMFRLLELNLSEADIVGKVCSVYKNCPLTKEMLRNIVRGKYETKLIMSVLKELDEFPHFQYDSLERNVNLMERWKRIKEEGGMPVDVEITNSDFMVSRSEVIREISKGLHGLDVDALKEILVKVGEYEVKTPEVKELPMYYTDINGNEVELFEGLEDFSARNDLTVEYLKELLYDITSIDAQGSWLYTYSVISVMRGASQSLMSKIVVEWGLKRTGSNVRSVLYKLSSGIDLSKLGKSRYKKETIVEIAAKYRHPRLKDVVEYMSDVS